MSNRVSLLSCNDDNGKTSSEKKIKVHEKYHDVMKSLMEKLQLNGKMLLATTWTTLKESLWFKISPWSSTRDVVEGLNDESRSFFMGLNTEPNRERNVHANMFLPSYKIWAFDWASKVSIVALYGKKTVDRVNINVFD